jgi:hypothetical protein
MIDIDIVYTIDIPPRWHTSEAPQKPQRRGSTNSSMRNSSWDEEHQLWMNPWWFEVLLYIIYLCVCFTPVENDI